LSKFLNLKKNIKKNEGYRNMPYKDILGYRTIGYGHLIKKNETFKEKKKINKGDLVKIFEEDFSLALKDYYINYKNTKHSKEVKDVLIEMIFQLGIEGQKKFVKMNKYLKKNQFFMAALEMKKSLWHKQTPKRVDGLIKKLLIKTINKNDK